MSSSMPITRLALTHAILTHTSPQLTAFDSISRSPSLLPPEIHAEIRTHLVASLARTLLLDLTKSLTAAVLALCNDCRAFNFHVYGERVLDWPRLEADGCRCVEVGRTRRPGPNALKDVSRCYVSITESSPPPWFQAHVRAILPSPYYPDIDPLITDVLLEFGCTFVSPKPSHSSSHLEDVLYITSLSSAPITPLLSLVLGLKTHSSILENSGLHPRHYKCLVPPPARTAPRTGGRVFPNILTGALWVVAVVGLVFSFHRA
ncbi:hypothetical protein BJ138DRAFT_1113095 [Hygrophoropsis aurantiaca]|uniref:Uncharacterized protein n=1 Tax=Hygrophoropsis aurantiaca TaxID=72124 RepID=A0ACB8ADQ7_9AGAM|nr:hypothetical protein BJ138DRAFT_1113095 [Hygrophoropsis aurantiaca]